MISNVAVQTTEASAGAGKSPGESADTGDTGAFDALLALQSVIDSEGLTAAANAPAGELDADLLGTQDDTDDSIDDSGDPEDALWFLSAILPKPHTPAPAAANSPSATVPGDISQGGAGATAKLATGLGDPAADLAQVFGSGDSSAEGDKSAVVLAAGSGATAVDTTNWNSLSGPAELFAHAARSGAAERTESLSLTTHVRDPRWADDLGNRLATMVRTGESSASLQLTPVDLGPLEVNVSVRDSQATVHFGAANAETRALLEASIPRLREMLAAQGFQLMDSSVSHGFARQTRHEAAGTPRVDGIGESPTPAAQTIHISGLLDLYA
jgi:flagellar hook-length control protein FliK